MSELEPVLAETVGQTVGRVGIIALNRPERFNCISAGLQKGLAAFEARRKPTFKA